MADSNQDRKDASQAIVDDADVEHGQTVPRKLARDLQGRHMQMIAIGKSLAPSILDVPELKRLQTAGAMGAGLFVGTGSSLQSGGPGALLVGFAIIGVMLLCTIQALGELTVKYPVNGAFFTYAVRFLDPAW